MRVTRFINIWRLQFRRWKIQRSQRQLVAIPREKLPEELRLRVERGIVLNAHMTAVYGRAIETVREEEAMIEKAIEVIRAARKLLTLEAVTEFEEKSQNPNQERPS